MLYCRRCGTTQPIGRSEKISLLRPAGKLRRQTQPDPEIVEALFQAELPRLACPGCGEASLALRDDADDEVDPEAWGEARRCNACGKPIHPDRLEILPETRQCSECAAAGKTGEADEREFCPRCGSELRLTSVRSGGLARYAPQCTGCGYRG